MPRKKDAKVLGRCECPACGGTMAVLQNARQYLYTQCDKCGCDQRNGAEHQTWVWTNTRWLDGMKPDKPPRNLIKEPEKVPEPQPEAEPVPEPEEPEKEQPKQPEGTGGGWGWLLVPVGIIAAIALKR